MAKKSKIKKSDLPVLSAGDAQWRRIEKYIPKPEVRPARVKKAPSALRTMVKQGIMTSGEAAETALKNRYFKKQGIKPKSYAPTPVSTPVRSTGFSANLKPDVPVSPKEFSERSLTRSKNAAMFSGVKSQDYDTFVKSLGTSSTGSRRMPLKIVTPKGIKRDLTFRYTSQEIAEKARSGRITHKRAKAWARASANRLTDRAGELAAQEAATAKAELTQQKARGVVRREKALERKRLYQLPETKRFREEKAKSKSSNVIYVAEKHGKITFPEYPNQKFVRVSEEAYRLSKEAEKIALKNKVAAEGQQSFAEALKNVESGAKVEVRRKVTEKELATAFENVQKEATILDKQNMPKAKVKSQEPNKKAKKGAKARLVKPAPKMELNAENLAKVLAGDEPKEKAGKAGKGKAPVAAKPKATTAKKPTAKPVATKPAEAPKAKVKPQATESVPKAKTLEKTAEAPKAKPKARIKPVSTPAPTTAEAPKPATKASKSKPKAVATKTPEAPAPKAEAPKTEVKASKKGKGTKVAAPAPVQEAPKATAAKPAASVPKAKVAPKANAAPKVVASSTKGATIWVDDAGRASKSNTAGWPPNSEKWSAKAKATKTTAAKGTAMVPVGARNDAKSRAAAGDARAAGVRARANAAELGLKARQKGAKMASSGSWKKRLVGGALVTAGSLLGAATLGYLATDEKAPTKPKPPTAAPVKPKPAATQTAPKAQTAPAQASSTAPASNKGSAAPIKQAVTKTRKSAKVAPKRTEAPAKPEQSAPAAQMTANPQKAIADFEAKLRAAGVVSIAGGAGGKAQMIPQPMSVTQLEDQFKKKKGPR